MRSLYFTVIFICVCCFSAGAQSGLLLKNDDIVKNPEMNQSNVRNDVRIPDIKGYYTMKCDLHSHTIFSDGDVWPTIRVKEAWQQGLDAVAITDHLEHSPRKGVVNTDKNDSYNIAKKQGEALDLLVIPGTEITRNKPFGHLNALFITDANPLNIKDSVRAIDLAVKQGAFIQWNHPGWPDNKTTLYPIHEKLIKEGKIHGVEVFNEQEYYPVSLDWCKKMNLAFTSNSDVHYLTYDLYGGAIRPMTLVFTTERSIKGIKDGLFARRSIAMFNDMLAGPEQYLIALMESSLKIKLISGRTVAVSNVSDITYKMTDGTSMFIFKAGKTTIIKVPETGTITVLNCFTGAKENLQIPVEYIKF